VHDLRRTAVRNLELAGIARSIAMKMTGHKTAEVYARYAIAESAMLEDGSEELAHHHAGVLGTNLGPNDLQTAISGRGCLGNS